MPWIILLFFCWMVRIATGCNLLHTYSIEVPKYVGESVLLPCSCADLQAKPQNVRWWKNTRQQIYPFKSHLDRIHMFNQDSPGNLSLLISDLTKEDEGNYRCEGSASYRDITLRVKGCSLMEKDTRFEIVKSSGESVLLPCSCSPLHVKPERVIWDFYRQRGSETGLTIEVPSTSGPYRGRVQMFNHHSPGNASLLISDLTEEDQGLYRCHLKEEVRRINLLIQDIVKNERTKTPPYIFILVAVVLLPLLLGGVIFLYMRHKGQKGERTQSGQMQERNNDESSSTYEALQHHYNAEQMYSTIGQKAGVQVNTGDYENVTVSA
ncbi:junctional adhesion molecule-like isoform X3 [Alosa pseudoharengus]|uniref:junctional adhesion molecule-like isoform X3 n=1 Tax=Alosa pseudoharengus TaxID=34774 RepID=UPI003F8ADDD4